MPEEGRDRAALGYRRQSPEEAATKEHSDTGGKCPKKAATKERSDTGGKAPKKAATAQRSNTDDKEPWRAAPEPLDVALARMMRAFVIAKRETGAKITEDDEPNDQCADFGWEVIQILEDPDNMKTIARMLAVYPGDPVPPSSDEDEDA
jgi:hypothetical protein